MFSSLLSAFVVAPVAEPVPSCTLLNTLASDMAATLDIPSPSSLEGGSDDCTATHGLLIQRQLEADRWIQIRAAHGFRVGREQWRHLEVTGWGGETWWAASARYFLDRCSEMEPNFGKQWPAGGDLLLTKSNPSMRLGAYFHERRSSQPFNIFFERDLPDVGLNRQVDVVLREDGETKRLLPLFGASVRVVRGLRSVLVRGGLQTFGPNLPGTRGRFFFPIRTPDWRLDDLVQGVSQAMELGLHVGRPPDRVRWLCG